MLNAVVPILPCLDVRATVAWFETSLGFRREWVWTDDVPDFASVARDGKSLFLQRVGTVPPGLSVWVGTDRVDELYEEHVGRGAEIEDALANRPWDVREYGVRAPDGWILRFAGPIVARESPVVASPPPGVTIERRVPTPEDHLRVHLATGGWRTAEEVRSLLGSVLAGYVAVEEGRVIGTALVSGDGRNVLYVQDVAVLPERQGRGVGSALMAALMAGLRETYAPGTLVILLTGKPAFYAPFGFVANGGAMTAGL